MMQKVQVWGIGIVIACLLILIGYWGAWTDHTVAGLVITGLDLGEYVKFLPLVRDGQVRVWREGFYWPLLAVSLTLSLQAFRTEQRFPWLVRVALIGVAIVAALNLLPPAWTPDKLRQEAEFRFQVAGLVFCLLAAGFSPFLALLPRRLSALLSLLTAAAALFWPLRDFLRVLPEISELYHRPLQPGWGVYTTAVGALLLLLFSLIAIISKDRSSTTTTTDPQITQIEQILPNQQSVQSV